MPSMGAPLVALRGGNEEIKEDPQRAILEEAQKLLTTNNSEADIIRKITQRFGVSMLNQPNINS